MQMLKDHSEKLKEALLAANKAKDLEKAKKLVADAQVSYQLNVQQCCDNMLTELLLLCEEFCMWSSYFLEILMMFAFYVY